MVFTKLDAERAVRHYCCVWRLARGLSDVSEKHLSFDDFFAWIQQHVPNALKFGTPATVRNDTQSWFTSEFGRESRPEFLQDTSR